MRFKSISLSWFRGAGEDVALVLDGKSAVVYGTNGSGKSSFVDAVEFAVNGKVAHLSHEYSGKRQEHGLPNTHRKATDETSIHIRFEDASERIIEIPQDGAYKSAGTEAPPITSWDYKRTVLRQDEVSAFIGDTKGDKYSAILPLLGLGELELAAENLRQLGKTVAEAADLNSRRVTIGKTQALRAAHFPGLSDASIAGLIASHAAVYLVGQEIPSNSGKQATLTLAAIDARVAALSEELREHLAVRTIAETDLSGCVDRVRTIAGRLQELMEPLLEERLGVLENAKKYVGQLNEEDSATCPACGSVVARVQFASHVEAERGRLAIVIALRDGRNEELGLLVDVLSEIKQTLSKTDLDNWCSQDPDRVSARAYVKELDLAKLRGELTGEQLDRIEEALAPLHAAAATHGKGLAPDAETLSNDRKAIDAAKAVLDGTRTAAEVVRADELIGYLAALERAIRAEIKARASSVIADISDDVQSMWAVLHPGRPIDDVALYMPAGVDKAIDIRLSFHGVAQDSPRLTLSEGYRNSLGLCIFLAMAKRESKSDRPLILDDVIVSLDRQHRAALVDVLQEHFSNRQVIILTHDREWFTELRHLFPDSDWSFQRLLPFEVPERGIRWAHTTSSFQDARAMLADRPDSAGNDARKIMDTELAMVAEKLQVRFPFVRGEKNDMRMAHALLKGICSEAKKCFECNCQTTPIPHTGALDALDAAANALNAWGNKASHTFDVVRPEAAKLLDACEAALDAFRCSNCKKPVWYAQAGGPELVQCACGSLRWRYGKAP